MTCDKTLIVMTCGYIYAWLIEELYLILCLCTYIKGWSFLDIMVIEMENEWIDEWKLMMYDMNCIWCIDIMFSGKKTFVLRNRMCIV